MGEICPVSIVGRAGEPAEFDRAWSAVAAGVGKNPLVGAAPEG